MNPKAGSVTGYADAVWRRVSGRGAPAEVPKWKAARQPVEWLGVGEGVNYYGPGAHAKSPVLRCAMVEDGVVCRTIAVLDREDGDTARGPYSPEWPVWVCDRCRRHQAGICDRCRQAYAGLNAPYDTKKACAACEPIIERINLR